MKSFKESNEQKEFFRNYWNNRIVTMHLQNKSTEQICNTIKVIANGKPCTPKHVSSILALYAKYLKRRNVQKPPTCVIGHKRESYYYNESEYMVKCVVPMSNQEMKLKVDKKHLDSNYKRFIFSQ